MEKTFFIRIYLANLLKALNPNITKCDYLKDASDNEYCIVSFRNEVDKPIVITSHSCELIVIDVMKALFDL